jgi:hypothetical protein
VGTGIWGFSVPGDILENSEKPGHREGVFTLLATTRSTLELPTHDYVNIYHYCYIMVGYQLEKKNMPLPEN